jgi:hypothetical protein
MTFEPELAPSKLISDLEWLWRRPQFVMPGALSLPLLEDELFKRHDADFNRLVQGLRDDIMPLREFLRARPRLYKLGLYAQTLLEFVFANLPELKLLACDLPVQAGQPPRTVGAFDFLLQEAGVEEVLHLEFALKILLRREGSGAPERPEDWIGPEGRDRLDLKLAKLQNSQLRLAETAEGRTLLRDRLGLDPDRIRPRLLLRGIGLVPWGLTLESDLISAASLQGFWAREGCPEADELRAQAFLLNEHPKLDWLREGCKLGYQVHAEWPLSARESD